MTQKRVDTRNSFDAGQETDLRLDSLCCTSKDLYDHNEVSIY